MIADDHKGLRAAARRVFNATHQRCRIHWMRNALTHAPAKQRSAVAAMLKTIFAQEIKADAEAQAPFLDNPDDTFVAIAHATPRPAMGGGAVVTEDGDTPGRVYHFRRSWIRNSQKATPSQLRIMHVEGDSMAPTLLSGDAVLVDMTRRAPNPPGIFVLDDGMGLVAKRLEHIPNSDPSAVRVISDNKHYPEYERTADKIRIVGRIRWFAREI